MGAGGRRPADPADRGRHRGRSRGLTWIRAIFAARPIGVLDVLFGAALALSAYGAAAAVTYVLTTPPFSAIAMLPRWATFSFFTASGMALIQTIFQTPIYLALTLLLRRRRSAGPVLLLLIGAAAGVIYAAIFVWYDGSFNPVLVGDFKPMSKISAMMGLVLAAFVILAAWLRRSLRR